MLGGILATRAVVFQATSAMPGAEIYEAIARDSSVIGYTLIGWCLTLVVSSALGYLASRWTV